MPYARYPQPHPQNLKPETRNPKPAQRRSSRTHHISCSLSCKDTSEDTYKDTHKDACDTSHALSLAHAQALRQEKQQRGQVEEELIKVRTEKVCVSVYACVCVFFGGGMAAQMLLFKHTHSHTLTHTRSRSLARALSLVLSLSPSLPLVRSLKISNEIRRNTTSK